MKGKTYRKCSKVILFVLCLGICMPCLSGCSMTSGGMEAVQDDPLTITGFAFDTTYTLTLYEGGDQELLDSCVALCNDYEKIFSRTREDSELAQINELESCYQKACGEAGYTPGQGKIPLAKVRRAFHKYRDESGLADQEAKITAAGALQITVSDDLSALLAEGLRYAGLSQGGFDCTIGRVSSLWDFTSHSNNPPSEQAIREALPFVDYRKVSVKGNVVQFDMPGMEIDLGGIAKGYIADRLKEHLQEGGVTGAIISLGGNILCIGEKSDGTPFRIGIQQPFADRQETIAAIAVTDVSVVSSGIYERYIETEDGTLYHHILNPYTGYSYENELLGVTIVSERSVDGDGLSTVCFALGTERGMEFAESLDGVEAVFITKDGKLHYTSGFEKMLCES